MLRKNRLFTHGPTPILLAAQTSMASFAMHHRTADFRALFSRVLSDLKQFIGTNNDVLVLTASGAGAMEGAVSNLIPPGLAYCAISERAWRRMETAKSPRYYFDFRKERKAAAKGESAFTPATSMFAALSAALDFVRQMGDGDMVAGREALVNNAELAAAMTRAGAQALGLKLFSPSSPSAALTAIKAPAGVNSGAIVKEFRESFAAVVAN